jgi:CelD/BcsL family acetyltransferase involved in cellulose biosynthesis
MRKAHRRLAQHEGIRFVTAVEPAELVKELESFLAIEASGWKGQAGTRTAIFLDQALVAFYRDLVRTLGGDGNCEINTLYADDRCIAAEFCVVGQEEHARLKIRIRRGIRQYDSRQAPNREHT